MSKVPSCFCHTPLSTHICKHKFLGVCTEAASQQHESHPALAWRTAVLSSARMKMTAHIRGHVAGHQTACKAQVRSPCSQTFACPTALSDACVINVQIYSLISLLLVACKWTCCPVAGRCWCSAAFPASITCSITQVQTDVVAMHSAVCYDAAPLQLLLVCPPVFRVQGLSRMRAVARCKCLVEHCEYTRLQAQTCSCCRCEYMQCPRRSCPDCISVYAMLETEMTVCW